MSNFFFLITSLRVRSLHTLRLLCLQTVCESPGYDVMALEASDRFTDNKHTCGCILRHTSKIHTTIHTASLCDTIKRNQPRYQGENRGPPHVWIIFFSSSSFPVRSLKLPRSSVQTIIHQCGHHEKVQSSHHRSGNRRVRCPRGVIKMYLKIKLSFSLFCHLAKRNDFMNPK